MMQIQVNRIRVPFRGGLLPDEDKLLQLLEIDISVEVDHVPFINNPHLHQTIDYLILSQLVQEVVYQGGELIEALAMEMDNRIRKKFPQVGQVDITIRKKPKMGIAYEHVCVRWVTP